MTTEREIKIGDSASLSKKIEMADLQRFSDLSMDNNPIHLSAEFAASTPFGRPIAQGMYVASFISAVLANHLPGPGSIYLGQEISFRKPVFVGDVITATVTVTEFPKPTFVRLSTVCRNQEGVSVIEGSALVKRS